MMQHNFSVYIHEATGRISDIALKLMDHPY